MRDFIKNFMSDSRKTWLLFILLTGGQFVIALFSFDVGLSPLNWLFFIFWFITVDEIIGKPIFQHINKILILFFVSLLLAVLICNFSIHGYYKFAQNITQLSLLIWMIKVFWQVSKKVANDEQAKE